MGSEEAIRQTIKYANNFGIKLTKEEIKERLISNKVYNLDSINRKFKTGNDNKYLKKKVKLAKNFVKKYLEKYDDILLAGITGSVAAKYPKCEDDIDMMVITKKDSLWLTRFKIYWILWKYKIPHRTKKDNFCFNLWLDETGMKIPKIKQNLKNAVDLVLMMPIINRHNIYKSFLRQNDWVKKYVATPYDKKIN